MKRTVVQLRISPQEKENARKLAKHHDKSISEMCRAYLKRAYSQMPEQAK